MKYIFFSILFFIFLFNNLLQAQVGITSISMTSSFNNSTSFNTTTRDNITIGDGVNPVIGHLDYQGDTLVIVGGDIVNFSLAFNDSNPATVKIWYDVNNDNDFESSELLHECHSTSPVSTSFPFPIDPLPIVPKGFSIQLIQTTNRAVLTEVTHESRDTTPTETPKLIVQASVNRKNTINGVVCVPSTLPFKFGVTSDHYESLYIESVELRDRVNTSGISLDTAFPEASFKINNVTTNTINRNDIAEGRITNNPLKRGEEGTLMCEISNDFFTIWADAKYKADCCPNESIEFTNEDTMYYFNSAFDFISIAEDVEINNGNCAFYKAENYIRMLPGFSAQAGSFVKAYIDPCMEFSGLMDENDINTQFLSGENHQSSNFSGIDDELTIFPNPFNGIFTLDYFVAKDKSDVKLIIYDILGKKLDDISHYKKQMSGTYQLQYDGNQLASGLYFIRLQIGNHTISKKIQKL